MKQAHEGRGYGADLVKHAEDVAMARGIPRVFALSNRAADFFTGKLGYTPAIGGRSAGPAARAV